ncbi:hypothetical protein [Gymnodinialimonas hymeniacidonis]|uniref:hypothetical protein n=1 Tax=Gymnodinialimonas hymeniacidonis TaxID=3126508 RepID=UPI0034C5E273
MSRVVLASLTFAIGVAALSLAVKPAAAAVLEAPAGGFRVIDQPTSAPRLDGFSTTASGSPNI